MTLTPELPQHATTRGGRAHPFADRQPHGGSEHTTANIREPSATNELTVDTIVGLLTQVRAALTDLDPDATPEQLLDQVLHMATRLLPGAEDASVAFDSNGELQTVAVAGDTALAADDIQRALGDGPSCQVLSEGRTLRIADLLTDPRWAEFAPLAAEVGVRAVLACPLPMPRKRLGVLSVYAGQPAAFDAAAELVIPVFAARAAIAAAYANKVTNLQRAIESRQVIGQAVGILMERHRLSAKQAFDTIVTTSQQSHIKLRELALRISETGEEPNAAAHDERCPCDRLRHGTARRRGDQERRPQP